MLKIIMVLMVTFSGIAFGFLKKAYPRAKNYSIAVKDDPSISTYQKALDPTMVSFLLRSTITGAQNLVNPCALQDHLRSQLRKFQKPRSKAAGLENNPFWLITHQMINSVLLPSVAHGINLQRTQFVLQETSNLTVFLDQNQDGCYSGTVLGNYSHFYVRAGNGQFTQILFVGLIETADLQLIGIDPTTTTFLTSRGLANHPRLQIDFQNIPSGEAQLILEKRQIMAEELLRQGTFWERDMEYLTDLMTVAFNGPETDREYMEMLAKSIKIFHQLVQSFVPESSPIDDYAVICAEWELNKVFLN